MITLHKRNWSSDSGVAGIMPQKHPFGFIFLKGNNISEENSPVLRTIAHELGHGLWGLDHTFVPAYKIPRGTTPHLMDYAGGTYLAYFEWSQIDNPVLNWSLFTGDEGNEAKFSLFHWLGNKMGGVSDDRQESQVEDILSLFDHVYENKSGIYSEDKLSSAIKLNHNKYNDWTILKADKNDKILQNIHNDESFVLKGKGKHIYRGNYILDYTGEKFFTYVNLYIFETDPTISDYKISSFDNLRYNNRVKCGYRQLFNDYMLVSFYDQQGNLSAILQISESRDKTVYTEKWAEYLLHGSVSNNKRTKRFIVSNSLAYTRHFNGEIVRDSIIPISSEIKILDTINTFNTDTLVKVKCIFSDNEDYIGKEFYTYKSNLEYVQTVNLTKPLNLNAMYAKFPYNTDREDIPIDNNITSCHIDAKCGRYYRVNSNTFVNLNLNTDSTWQGCWIDTGYFHLDTLRLNEIIIYVKRTSTGSHSTTGIIRTDDGSIRGYTVEQPRGTDDECEENCNDNTKPFQCHCIVEGTYSICLNTYGHYANRSLRINQIVPANRSGILLHKGQDDAEGWSQGCILPVPNQPVLDLAYAERFRRGRNNTQDESQVFVDQLYDWFQNRTNENPNHQCRIIIKKSF